eukprot:scaffold194515_cov27-Tisochrysis_lutea.AAC.1
MSGLGHRKGGLRGWVVGPGATTQMLWHDVHYFFSSLLHCAQEKPSDAAMHDCIQGHHHQPWRITPWVILNGHRPMYVSSTNKIEPDGEQPVAEALRNDLEQLILDTQDLKSALGSSNVLLYKEVQEGIEGMRVLPAGIASRKFLTFVLYATTLEHTGSRRHYKDQVLILMVCEHPYVPEVWPDQDQNVLHLQNAQVASRGVP